MNKLIKYFKDKKYRFYVNGRLRINNLLPDKVFLKILYRVNFDKKLDLKQPKTFNEKLNFLKLYDRNINYVNMVDKYEAKKYFSNLCGEQHVIKTLGIYKKIEDIDFSKLPNQFVIKTTHDSGGVFIVKDKKDCDFNLLKQKISKRLKINYFKKYREWPYKKIKPRILIEEFVRCNEAVLPVYKFFCFNGKVKIIQAIQNDKTQIETIDYYNENWEKLNLKQNFPNSESGLKKPANFSDMVRMAEKLSVGFPFLRIDFYNADDNILFSEFTFYSDAGIIKFEPEEWDSILGSYIDLGIIV